MAINPLGVELYNMVLPCLTLVIFLHINGNSVVKMSHIKLDTMDEIVGLAFSLYINFGSGSTRQIQTLVW